MPNDHYVAETYLKHFGDPTKNGVLHAYRKNGGKPFYNLPKSFCHEWNGDLNEAFLSDQELLGYYRKIFEPHWNKSVENILTENISHNDKFIISAYMANLMTCTPAWRRVGQKMYNDQAVGFLSFSNEMNKKHGKEDELLAEGIDMIKKGKLKFETYPDYIKAVSTTQLLEQAWRIYNQNWLIISNNTTHPFLTSDNPVAIENAGITEKQARFLTITPKLCLYVKYDNHDFPPFNRENPGPCLQQVPEGIIQLAQCKDRYVQYVNSLIVKCAEDFIFSPAPSSEIATLVAKYSKYRIDVEYVEIPTGKKDSLYQGSIITVKEHI